MDRRTSVESTRYWSATWATEITKKIAMCDQKEREFMEELYRKYERLMYATVRRYISDSMEQEEIVQESLKKLIEKRRVLCNLDCAAQAGYIVVAIRNTSFSYLRKRNRERSNLGRMTWKMVQRISVAVMLLLVLLTTAMAASEQLRLSILNHRHINSFLPNLRPDGRTVFDLKK